MSIRLACPTCKASCAVSEDLRGKKVRCGSCQQPFMVPGGPPAAAPPAAKPSAAAAVRPAPAAPPPPRPPAPSRQDAAASAIRPAPPPLPRRPAANDDDERSRRKRQPQGGNKGMLLLLIGGGAGLALLAAIVVIVLVTRSSAKDEPPVAQRPLPPVQGVVDPNALVKKQDPPIRKQDPLQKIAELPPGPAPQALSPETMRRVKRATAYLRVNMSTGGSAEGSGFFAGEPGLVFTNAHVLGMLSPASPAPTGVEVVVNSGEPDELRFNGTILGVDRATDLAVLRVQGDLAKLPPPLPVDSSKNLIETQKVYILGFPFGIRLGKNITVTESSVTSLRRDATGTLTEVQVNGGMQPGNSGGPVVDTRGVVVGVSVSIIKGTQISMAVPADNVKLILEGRHSGTELGLPYIDAGQTRMTVKLACLDPLGRIRDLKLDVWTGPGGPNRPLSFQAPIPLAGDGPRQTVPVKYANGNGVAEILLPIAPPGQVVWVQPVLTSGTGATQWAVASAYQASPQQQALERRPAMLQLKFPAAQAERTLKVKNSLQVKAIEGAQVLPIVTDEVDVDVLELIKTGPRGAVVKIAFGNSQGSFIEGGKGFKRSPAASVILRRLTAEFDLDPNGKFLTLRSTGVRAKDPLVEEDLSELYSRACNTYQTTCLTLPNRTLNPLESWNATPVMFYGAKGKKKDIVDLNLVLTYEGLRTTGGRSEAYIRFDGDVKSRKAGAAVSGRARGFAIFDVEGGYFSQVKFNVTSEFGGDRAKLVVAMDTDFTRRPGNDNNIQVPTKPPGPGPATPGNFARGKVRLNIKNQLAVTDPIDPRSKNGCRYKLLPFSMIAGKTYIIEMNQAPGSTLDPYLRLEDTKGNVLAEDDDSGGNLNARIVYTATRTGVYRIVATSFVPGEGAFTFTITDAIPAPKGP